MPCGSFDANFCTGGTPSASDYYDPDYAPSKAFDGNASTFWAADSQFGSHWLQYELAVAKQARKLFLKGPDPNNGLKVFDLLASNTGAFLGEQVTLLSVSTTWTAGEEKSWEFDNDTAFLYYRISGSGSDLYQPGFATVELYECLGEYTEIEADITDGTGIDDAFEVFDYKGVLVEGSAFGDVIDAINLSEIVTEAATIADWITGGLEFQADITDAATVADAVVVGFEYSKDITEAVAIADVMSAFNYGAFLTQYGDLLTRRFYFTLTGAPDSKADAIIPISSFTLRRRNGEPSYLSVVIPSIEYADYVTDRPNGEMVLEIAYLYQGAEVLREEIGRVDLEDVRTDQGARSKSITLSGHKTESFTGQICTLQGVSYKSQSNATWTARADIEPYARPGDTIRISGVDLFEASLVTMYGAADGAIQMEVSG